jgi:hypothetical protein
VPTHPPDKKLSKNEILRLAIKYINLLNTVVHFQKENHPHAHASTSTVVAKAKEGVNIIREVFDTTEVVEYETENESRSVEYENKSSRRGLNNEKRQRKLETGKDVASQKDTVSPHKHSALVYSASPIYDMVLTPSPTVHDSDSSTSPLSSASSFTSSPSRNFSTSSTSSGHFPHVRADHTMSRRPSALVSTVHQDQQQQPRPQNVMNRQKMVLSRDRKQQQNLQQQQLQPCQWSPSMMTTTTTADQDDTIINRNSELDKSTLLRQQLCNQHG